MVRIMLSVSLLKVVAIKERMICEGHGYTIPSSGFPGSG